MFATIATLHRGVRAAAAGALILALSATGLGGSAVASPSAEVGQGCSVLAHERNESLHRLHEAWRGFSQQLRDLSRESRQVARVAKKAGTELTADARDELSTATQDLNAIRTKAHAELQNRVELGTVCKQPQVTDPEMPHITLVELVEVDEDGGTVTLWVQFNEGVSCDECTTLFTYAANGEADAVEADTFELDEDGTSATVTFKLDEDVTVDGSNDKLSFTMGETGSVTDGDENAMESDSQQPVELSIQTNDLVKKYREVVDQAIKDMQAVVDDVAAAVAEMLAAAETDDESDDAKAKKIKEERGKDRERGKPANAGRGRGPNR